MNWPLLAATDGILIDYNLNGRPITLQSLRDGVLVYFDSDRSLQSESIRRILQIRFRPTSGHGRRRAAPLNEPAPPGMLLLIDGQRLVGRWAGAGDSGDRIQWRSEILGRLEVALDDIAALSFTGAISDKGRRSIDQIVLTNGDVVSGFVDRFVSGGIRLSRRDTSPPLVLDLDRVKVIRLANPVQQGSASGHVIHLADHTQIMARDLKIGADRVTLVGSIAGKGNPVAINMQHVRRIDFASTEARLVELTELKMSVLEGGEVFGLRFEPRTDASRIKLHAPIKVGFDLPPHTRRFTATASLDVDTDQASDALGWADLELVVSADNKILSRYRLTAQTPTAQINVPVNGTKLTLELDPAANGPVMDRLVLSEALVLVGRQ